MTDRLRRPHFRGTARTAGAGIAALAMAVSLAACSDGGSNSGEAINGPTGNGTAEMPQESQQDAPQGGSKVEVSSVGDGPTGLRANHGTGDVSANGSGSAGIYQGRLITASGNCLSVTDNDRPDLVVFPEDTEFDFNNQRPSVSSGDLDPLYVGEEIRFAGVAVPIDGVDGIPRHCAQGASDMVQVVQGW